MEPIETFRQAGPSLRAIREIPDGGEENAIAHAPERRLEEFNQEIGRKEWGLFSLNSLCEARLNSKFVVLT
jgi:hypothetical protein